MVPGPGRSDYDALILSGSDAFGSEVLHGLEAGYRFQPQNMSVDLAVFRNSYDDLLSAEPVPSPVPGTIAGRFANGTEGETRGGEVAVTWSPRPWLKVFGSYAGISFDLRNESGANDVITLSLQENSLPRSETQGRVYLDLPKRFELTGIAYYMASFPGGDVDPFVRNDVRLGWQAGTSLDLAVGVQDLFNTASIDVVDLTGIASAPGRRTIFAEMRWSLR